MLGVIIFGERKFLNIFVRGKRDGEKPLDNSNSDYLWEADECDVLVCGIF